MVIVPGSRSNAGLMERIDLQRACAPLLDDPGSVELAKRTSLPRPLLHPRQAFHFLLELALDPCR